jgi:hypothetical protein
MWSIDQWAEEIQNVQRVIVYKFKYQGETSQWYVQENQKKSPLWEGQTAV